MMVDGAVVMVENGFRLLSHQAGRTVNRTHVILEAAREVINPIAFAILIIIVVFLPLFSLTGLEGKLFKPMALTITFAMVGSLVLTLTLVPVLSALILKPKEEKDTFLVRWAKRSICPCSTGRWRTRRRSSAGLSRCWWRRSPSSRSSARSSCRACRKARSCSG
jgi:cobalt-zinc-cadmium resistance protein CzcA